MKAKHGARPIIEHPGPQEGYHVVDPKTMSNRSLRNNFCEPWYGCFQCTSLCGVGKEYMRRVEAGEMVKLREDVAV